MRMNQWNLFTDSGEGVIKYCNGVLTTVINNKSWKLEISHLFNP